MIGTPTALFNYGATISSPGLAPITVTPGIVVAAGDAIYVNLTWNNTATAAVGNTFAVTVTDSEGNVYNRVSTCIEGGQDGTHAPTVMIDSGTYVALSVNPLTISSTITLTFDTLTATHFLGDVATQGLSVSGAQCQELGVGYIGPNDARITPSPTPSAFSVSLPRLTTDAQILIGTVGVTGATVSAPPGWTTLQTKTQGSIEHATYYKIVSANAPNTLNATLSAGTGYANYIADSLYAGPIADIADIQVQGQNTLAGSSINVLGNWPTNFNDLIVLQVALVGSVFATPSVSDTQGNTYVLGTTTLGSGVALYSFHCLGAAKPLLITDSWTVDCSGSTLTDGAAAVTSVSSCKQWVRGTGGAGSYNITANPSFSAAVGSQSSIAFGYAAALTSAITDPAYTAGWGLCLNSNVDSSGVWINLYTQRLAAGGSLTLAPTLGSPVGSLLNIETFFVSGAHVAPKPSSTAIAYADILEDQYQFNGAASSLGALFEQDSGFVTGDLIVDGSGLLAKVSNNGAEIGSSPVFTSALQTALDAIIATGLDVIIEWSCDAIVPSFGGDIVSVVGFETATGGIEIRQQTRAGGGTITYPQTQLLAELGGANVHSAANPPGFYQTMNLGQCNQAAFKFTASSMSLSVNGGPVQTVSTVTQAWPMLFGGFGNFESAAELDNGQGVHIKFFAAYPSGALSVGDLPAYSAVCARPGAGGISQGYIF